MKMSFKVTVVIPCYKVQDLIVSTIQSLPEWIDEIVLVDDASPDQTLLVLQELSLSNTKVTVLTNKKNMGVGGAMMTGFQYAMASKADLVVKMDGDGQMNPVYLDALLQPLCDGVADYVKGNRFNDFQALQDMPLIRRVGNLGLSFLTKAASGYWDVFDPTNGYIAISVNTLRKVNFSRLSPRYFFESSMLIELYYAGAVVKDIPMPAIYGEEVSNLSISRALFGFPPKLLRAVIRRIRLSYFIYDFNLVSIYILGGLPLFLFGLLFGLVEWVRFASMDIPAPLGTVMLAVLPFILGFQMLLSAVQHDVQAKNPFKSH
jgi:dolichol-phosphate mannosyltransferase